MRILLFTFLLGFIGPFLAAQAAPELSADQAQQDARVLRRALVELHPALYKYRSEAEISAAFARFETRASGARTRAEMFLAASEVTAAIRCGHTWPNPRFNQKPAVTALLTERPDKLPFHVVLVESRWLITASAISELDAGDELLALSGVAAPGITVEMMPYLRADGARDGKRLIQLSHEDETSQMDFIWPLLHPPVAGRYPLIVKRTDGRTEQLAVPAITLADRRALLSPSTQTAAKWTTEYRGDLCILTLPTFSFWNNAFDWRAYLTKLFADLATKGTRHLVIDLRANEGGSGEIGPFIVSHLIRDPLPLPAFQPISAYERVPYILARYLDTWDFGFFDRTGQVEKLGDRRYLIKTRMAAAGAAAIAPQAVPFAGKTYVLIGGQNSSATFVLANFVKLSRAATLIGQPTGGNLRGLNGGELCWVNLPNSGVGVDIPLLGSFPVPEQPDAGVEPDILVIRTFDARAAGRDVEMEKALGLIAAVSPGIY